MSVAQRNQLMLRKLIVIALIMAGFGFALVPLYRQICDATGISQTRAADSLSAANTQVDSARWVTIEFIANNNAALSWRFEPLTKIMRVHPGEIGQVVYQVENTTGRTVVGQAVPSYGPSDAAKYFKKIQCFCFARQTINSAETRQMPVVFVISPDLPRDINTVTVSYTFFDVTRDAAKDPANRG